MPDFSIGVDLGGTNLRIAAIRTDGQLLEKITLGVKVARGRDHVIGEMCDAIHRLSDQYRNTGRLVGAGIGVPGIIDMETGIGGAIILNGKIFYGMNGMAGEFGHVTIEPDGVPCGCGNHGCAERYASATAVVRMAREAIESGQAPELARAASSDAEFSARSIYILALQGNEDARQIFRRFGVAL